MSIWMRIDIYAGIVLNWKPNPTFLSLLNSFYMQFSLGIVWFTWNMALVFHSRLPLFLSFAHCLLNHWKHPNMPIPLVPKMQRVSRETTWADNSDERLFIFNSGKSLNSSRLGFQLVSQLITFYSWWIMMAAIPEIIDYAHVLLYLTIQTCRVTWNIFGRELIYCSESPFITQTTFCGYFSVILVTSIKINFSFECPHGKSVLCGRLMTRRLLSRSSTFSHVSFVPLDTSLIGPTKFSLKILTPNGLIWEFYLLISGIHHIQLTQ